MDRADWKKKGEGHRSRLRDRFIERGLSGFTDVEVIELLLSFGTPRKDCKTAANELLKRFGRFSAVLDADAVDLQQVDGIGAKNSFALMFIKSVADRYLKDRLRSKSYLKSSHEVLAHLRHSMRGLTVEVFSVIYLDSALAIIDSEVVASGTINLNTVYPREIIRRCLVRNAAALVVAHNHPSGSVEPSRQDKILTKNLALACNMMQLRLLDHIIVGDEYYSFADQGVIAEIGEWCSRLSRDHLDNPSL